MTTISIPVMDNGKALAYVGADIDLDKTAAELAAKRPLGDGYVALLSSANAFVSHPDKAVMGKPLKDSGLDAAAWEGLLKSPGTVGTMIDKDGVERMAIALPIEPFPGAIWNVVVAVPSATVLGALTDTVSTSALIIAGAAVILIVVGWLLARRFIGRINRVIGQTTEIASGRLDVELTDKDRSDELGDLPVSRRPARQQPQEGRARKGSRSPLRAGRNRARRTLQGPQGTRRGNPFRRRRAAFGPRPAVGWRHDRAPRKALLAGPRRDPRQLQRFHRETARGHDLLPRERDHNRKRLERNPLRRRRSGSPYRTAGGLRRANLGRPLADHPFRQGIDPARRRSRPAGQPHQGKRERSGEVVRSRSMR